MGQTDFQALRAQSEQLRVEFLNRELELTQTFLDTIRLELAHGHDPHVAQGMEHVRHGLDTIRKFINGVSSEDTRARIADRLERLATDFARLEQQHNKAK